MEKSNYNYCLDYIKGIACIFVVLMHCEFPGLLGTLVQTVSRFCVPFFFMVSGYYWYQLNSAYDALRVKRKVGHIFKIVLYSSLFYIAFAVIQNLIWKDTPIIVTKTTLAVFLFFNRPSIVVGQMWFLYALLYVYIGAALMDRFSLQKKAYVWGGIMLLSLFVLGQGLYLMGGKITVPGFISNDLGDSTRLSSSHISIPNFLYRNWLVEGTAFFMLGHWIHSHEIKLKSINNRTLLIIIITSTLLCIFERILIGRDFGVNICSLPQVFALFVYGIKNPRAHEGTIQRLGKKCSMLVYILHPFVWHSCERAYSCVGLSDNLIAMYLLPIIVVIMTVFISCICNRLFRIST